ncbi:hypothetical protein Btru_068912 [Bulinus truncatus]|nr:hypothetical protein Btru_068912 [Bulinus truncatus]
MLASSTCLFETLAEKTKRKRLGLHIPRSWAPSIPKASVYDEFMISRKTSKDFEGKKLIVPGLSESPEWLNPAKKEVLERAGLGTSLHNAFLIFSPTLRRVYGRVPLTIRCIFITRDKNVPTSCSTVNRLKDSVRFVCAIKLIRSRQAFSHGSPMNLTLPTNGRVTVKIFHIIGQVAEMVGESRVVYPAAEIC